MTQETAPSLVVTYKRSADLKPHNQNSRTHTRTQVKAVARSIETYGWTNPILVDENDQLIAGHARLEAAKLLGLIDVPTICLAHMTLVQKRAYVIADNRMNEIAGSWDRKILALEHEAICLLDPSFDITNTGFSLQDIEIIIDGQTGCAEDEVALPAPNSSPVSALGDLWLLGEHKLLCGNALHPDSFEALMGDERAQLVLTDPPYNVRINGNVARKGRHREFLMASGEMTSDQFTVFLTQALSNLRKFSSDGSIHYLFMDWRHMAEMGAATAQYSEMKNLICWNKESAGMGAFYRSKHELIWVMKNGSGRHINNFGLGEKGRHRTNVWDYAGLAGWAPSRSEDLAMHPTVKPVAMIADALKDCSQRNGIVLDCFGGSGTTLMAAERTGRRARLIELDPLYIDVIIRRWEADTGRKAILAQEDRTCTEVEKENR